MDESSSTFIVIIGVIFAVVVCLYVMYDRYKEYVKESKHDPGYTEYIIYKPSYKDRNERQNQGWAE